MITSTIVITVLLGIAASLFTEVATAINKVLNNTVLKGDGAFGLAFGMAFIAAIIKEMMMPGFTFGELTNLVQLGQFFSETFAISQIFFLMIYQRLGLDINSDGQVTGPVVVAPVAVAAAPKPAAVDAV